MNRAKELGNLGEAETARYLRRQKYTLLASQWRCRFGELDLVAKDRDGTICFVEVKLRGQGALALPREFVDRRKQEKLRKTASFWLMEHQLSDAPARFDVAEVYVNEQNCVLRLEYLKNAFQ